jgi:hypothetical protein
VSDSSLQSAPRIRWVQKKWMNSVAWGDAPPPTHQVKFSRPMWKKVVVEALQCHELKFYWLSRQDYQTDVAELSLVLTLLLFFLIFFFLKGSSCNICSMLRKFIQHLFTAKYATLENWKKTPHSQSSDKFSRPNHVNWWRRIFLSIILVWDVYTWMRSDCENVQPHVTSDMDLI